MMVDLGKGPGSERAGSAPAAGYGYPVAGGYGAPEGAYAPGGVGSGVPVASPVPAPGQVAGADPYAAYGSWPQTYGAPAEPAYVGSVQAGVGAPYGAPGSWAAGGYGAPEGAWVPAYGCSFAEAVRRFFVGYARLRGRSSLSEYWFAYLFQVLVSLGLTALSAGAAAWGDGVSGVVDGLVVLCGFALLPPCVSVSVRRLHDSDRPGSLFAGVVGASIGAGILGVVGFVLFIIGGVGSALGVGVGVGDGGFGGVFMAGAVVLGVAFVAGVGVFAWQVWLMTRPSDPNGVRWDA